ncbi:MAG: hypothetical protein HOU81_18615 [Hamadaea sp.]|uniref:hypothetical protein n=1 Tax=Hamadaea sp. TaxID=2024425 RepID=UPI0017F9744F|nr:hypothetical protein [Hamadaea sp.]NUR72831.1 hypothetical protein [Hamadaea sp.]NUT20454.1 hypothetical protein [Hamadaea sp.]
MKSRIAITAVLSLVGILLSAAPADAATSNDEYTAEIIGYASGIPFLVCQAHLNVRSSDGYVQGGFRSYDNTEVNLGIHRCIGWLERRSIKPGNSYGWTKVSNFYEVYNGSRWTGWHWNGDDAESRVCISDMDGPDAVCSTGHW